MVTDDTVEKITLEAQKRWVIRTMLELTRFEWIAYDWIDVTTYTSRERKLLRGKERTPAEGAQAARDWEQWYTAARHCYGLKAEDPR